MLKSPNECKICKNLRSLSEHLFEMAEFCSYLDNTVQYKDANGEYIVHTTVIGDWLKLASQLEKVEINTWKFAGDDAFYCGEAGDSYDSDSKHFSEYSTALTRFMFICNALEECYRFVAHNYDDLAIKSNISKKERLKSSSMKSAALVDSIDKNNLPINFKHMVGNLEVFFKDYYKEFSPHLNGMEKVSTTDISYALHLIRNLRNHIAHGVFPLVDNHEYSSAPPLILFTNLLFHACRAGTIYIQILLGRYNEGFQSYDYDYIQNADAEEYDFFIQHCTVEYSKYLHMHGDFTMRYPYKTV